MCIREPEAFLTLPGAAPAPIPKKNCFVRASSGHSKGTYNNEFIMKPLGITWCPPPPPAGVSAPVTPALSALQKCRPFWGAGQWHGGPELGATCICSQTFLR